MNRKAVVVVVVAAAVVLTGLVVTTFIRHAGRPDQRQTPPPAHLSPDTTTTTFPIPFPSRSRGPRRPTVAATDTTGVASRGSWHGPSPSATGAAIRFLKLDENLFPPVSGEKSRALTESIASTVSRSRLGREAFDHQTQTLAKGDLAGLKLRIAPIAARTRICGPAACTVDVFFLRLWSFPGQGALDDYATTTINLVYENGSWRLASSSLIDGPYPAGRYSAHPATTANSKVFETDLAGFTDSQLTP